MFDLEEQISAWRVAMVNTGIEEREVLDELEAHLREDVEEQRRVGKNDDAAFAGAVENIGRGELLKPEFTKASRTRNTLPRLAGTDNNYMGELMNSEKSNLESRWATYGKTIAFAGPAIGLWFLSAVFIVPKANQICHAANLSFPAALRTTLEMTNFLRANFMVVCAAVAIGIALFEWRSTAWARYRTTIFGVGIVAVNSAALISIMFILVMVLLSAGNLIGPMK
jgi:hypothetical protein